jgi:hypothetical protein
VGLDEKLPRENVPGQFGSSEVSPGFEPSG